MTAGNLFASRQVLHLVDRAENMLAVSADYLTDRHRDKLWEALKSVMAMAKMMDIRQPVSHSDLLRLLILADMVGGLGDARNSVKKRIASNNTARARRGKQVRLEIVDLAIAEEEKAGGKATEVRERVNTRLVALRLPVISLKTYYERRKKIHEMIERENRDSRTNRE
jgi:hypothetical protein